MPWDLHRILAEADIGSFLRKSSRIKLDSPRRERQMFRGSFSRGHPREMRERANDPRDRDAEIRARPESSVLMQTA